MDTNPMDTALMIEMLNADADRASIVKARTDEFRTFSAEEQARVLQTLIDTEYDTMGLFPRCTPLFESEAAEEAMRYLIRRLPDEYASALLDRVRQQVSDQAAFDLARAGALKEEGAQVAGL